MVLDNVDDPEIFFGCNNADGRDVGGSSVAAVGRKLADSIPRYSHRGVLVTTRNKQAALKLSSCHGILHIEPLDRTESHDLITKRLYSDSIDPEQTCISLSIT